MTANTKREMVPVPQSLENLEYRAYSEVSEITNLSLRWDALLTGSSCNRAFGSLEWFLASCRIQDALKPYLITAALGPDLVCILPLAIDPRTDVGEFPHVENDYNDALVRGNDPAVLAGVLRYAISNEAPCHRLRLSKLKPNSLCVRAATILNSGRGVACRSRDMKLYRSIKLPATFDEYLASRKKPLRRNVRRALRRSHEDGLIVRQIHARDLMPSELPDVFLRLILDRHGAKCAFHQAHAQSFIREVLPPAFRKGSLLAFAMLRNEEIVGIDLYLGDGDGLLSWSGGFMAEMEPWSPGSILIACAIQRAIAMRLDEIDFGEGDEPYKQAWTNGSYITREVDIVSR